VRQDRETIRGVLAYVFWHRPADGQDAAEYERALARFHAVLAGSPPGAYGGSCAIALGDAPWLAGGGAAYEDWYLVPSWAALGELNERAVTGARASPHDAAAARAAAGVAGVCALVAGTPEPPAHGWRAWLAKPPGLGYEEFHVALAAVLPDGAAAWQRQMTLGPAGEYALSASGPVELPWPAFAGEARRVA
jgi:hypothetical protein